MSDLEEAFAAGMESTGWASSMEREHRFHPVRRWRFDFAWPAAKVAVEIEGGTWNAGRHTRGSGFAQDCEKYNTAVVCGWRVLRFIGSSVDDGNAVAITVALLDRINEGMVA